MENRNGLPIDFTVAGPTGTSEREQANALMCVLAANGLSPKTLGADWKYSDGDSLVVQCCALGITPHFAVRDDRPNALALLCHDGPGYSISMRCRMRIEEILGYVKTITGIAKLKVRGHLRGVGRRRTRARRLQAHPSRQARSRLSNRDFHRHANAPTSVELLRPRPTTAPNRGAVDSTKRRNSTPC
jgi:hypothetical protein